MLNKLTLAVLGIAFSVALFSARPVLATGPDSTLDLASAEALSRTVTLLTSPAMRAEAIRQDPKAQLIDGQVKALTANPALTEEIYRLSSEIFAELAKSSGGDSQKMLETLNRAKSDPKGFAASLSPKSRAALSELARKISTAPVAGSPSR
ncbi:MAG: hypothetical protein NDJ89_03870 [Oligoflexia bacterium]|nr:hypothetical protein [Oligoflexia bacterium]